MKRIISATNAPAAIGPYSQAVEVNGTLYISGQLPIVPATGEMPPAIEEQTLQCLKNIDAILGEAGYSKKNIVKCTVLLDNMDNFAAMNEVYGKFFTETYPARVAYQVAKLPKSALVEIEATAAK